MQQLATIIREQIDTLVDQYDARLRTMPGYSNLPEAMRREMERHFLNLIAESLDAGDYSLLVQYAQQRASQWDARGLNLAWFQQALIVPEELLVPLVQSVETSNFVWRALNRGQSVIWQMVAERTHQTEERFRSIVETAHSGILIIDDQFHFIYANEQLTHISGYSQAELIGADFRQLLDEDSRRIVADRYAHRQQGEDVSADYEITFIRKDGQKRYMEMSAVLLQDASGRQQTVAQVLDVSERKQSEQALRDSQQLLQSVMDNIPQAVFWKDRQLRYLGCNQAFAEDTGLNLPQSIVGKTDYDMPWQTQAELYRADDQHVMDSGAAKINYEEQQTTPSGEITWLRTSKIPMHDADANVIAVLGMYEDITERKQLEQRIRKSLELREQQVRSGTEVSQEIAAAPDLNELFKRVVTLIKERFNYYHAQIFRYDSVLDAVVLVAGYGQVGQHMLSDGHHLPMGHGVAGAAAATGRSILASDVRQDEDWRPNPHLPETKGELAVPIKLREEVLGILDVQSDRAGALSDDDRLLLEGLCGQIAVAMESTRLLDRTETLYRISSQLSEAQTYDEVLLALRQHTLLQQADLNISINLYDRPWVGDDMPDWSTTLTRWSRLSTSAVSPRYPLKAFSAASALLRPDEPTIVSDVQNDPRLDAATRELYGKRFGAGSTLFLPLVTAGKWIGYVNAVFSQPRSFEEEAVRLLTSALKQAGTVIESLRRLNDLTTSGAQLSEALKIAKLGYWEYDVEKDLFLFNDQFYSIFHTTAEQTGGYQLSSTQYAQTFVYPDDLPMVGAEIEKALNSTDRHYTRDLDHRIQYADGGVGYISVNINIDRDEQGRILRYYGANQDITERRQVELDLAQERNLLRTLIDTLPERIFAKDTQSRFTMANAAEIRLDGASSFEELRGKNDFDFYPADLAQQYYDAERPIIEEGRTLIGYEERSVDHEGNTRWHISTKVPLRDTDDGHIVGLVGMTRDITQIKEVEAALVEERNRLRTLIDNLPVSVFIKDRESRFMVNNAVHLRILGAESQEEVSGKWDFDYFPQELAAQYYADEQELMRIGQPLFNREEFVVDHASGKRQWALSTKIPLRDSHDQVTGFLGFTQDITERKLAEQALQRNETELSEALRIAQMGNWSYDVPTDTFTFNDQFYALMRTTAEREGGYTMSSAQYTQRFVHPDDAALVGTEIGKALTTTDPNYRGQIDHRIYYADGELGYITVRFYIEKDAQGHTVKTHGANQDITKRRLAEEAIRRSEAELTQALQIAHLADWSYDVPTDTFTFNDQFYALMRTTAEREGGYTMSSAQYTQRFVHPDDAALVGIEIGKALAITDPNYRGQVDHRIYYADGELGYITVRFYIEKDAQGRTIKVYGANQDITERKLVEAERERLIAEQQTRAMQLQTAAEVGRVATSILNPEQLLGEIVTLIAARFGLYHVAAFTVDESGRWAQLRAATGEVGQQMIDRGQALGIHGKSLVGNAIRHRQPRIALDVGAEAVQFNDPLLPTTRSEIVLPLFVGDRALGALDAQSTRPAAFDENFAILLQSMADQIAVALNNAEKYQREQAHVEQTNRLIQIVIDLSERTDRAGLQNRLVQSALSLLDTDRAQFWLKGVSGLELKAAQSVRLGADQNLAISQELADQVYRTGLLVRLDSPPVQAGYASRITEVPFNAALMAPISWQGHTTGVLSVMRSQPGRPFTQDDENSAQLLAAQAAAALENITLAEQQQYRAMQLQTAAEVSQATSSILNLDALLPQAAEVVRARFNLYYVGIFLNDEADRWAVLRAGTGGAGQQMLADGHKLKIGETSMISQCIVKQQARIALDVGEEAVRFDNPQLPLTRSELALPLINRGRVIGAVTIQSDQPAAFTSDDITVLQTMADQIGNAVENARLYEQSNAALQEVDALNRRLTGEAWESYLHQQAGQHVISVTDDSQTAPDLLPQLDGLLAAGEIVVELAEDDRSEATVTAPILLRGQAIGALRMRTPLDAWDKDTEAILTGITGHIAQAVENARLMEQTQRTASRERAINEINARVRQTIDLDAILRTAVNELGQSLKAARVTAHINVADSNQPSRRYAGTGSQPDAAGSPRGNDHD